MHVSIAIEKSHARPLEIGRKWPAVALFIVGLILIYGVGFVSMPAVHNATHDARHAAGFPCH